MPKGSQPWGSGGQLVPVRPSRSFLQSYDLHLPCRVRVLCLGWASTAVWGRAGRIWRPSAQTHLNFHAFPRMQEVLKGQKARKDSSAIRCDPGCCFSGGDSPHKGPFVLSFPWPELHCSPQRRAQWGIV